MTRIAKLGRGIALASAMLVAACANLPDLSGYTAATVDVRTSVASAGSAVQAEIGNAALTVDGDARAQINGLKTAYGTAWDQTVAAMDAMVRYAESVEAIAAAGNKGQESALAVGQQVRELAGAVGIPLAAPVGAVISTGSFIWGELAKIEGARSLEAAIAASGPAIERLQTVVAQQVADSRTAFDSALRQQARALQYPDAYGTALASEARLRGQIAGLSATLAQLPAGDPATDGLTARMDVLTKSSSALAPQLAEYKARADAIEARRRAGTALLDASETALEAWGAAHSSLVASVRNRSTVTLVSLNSAVADVRILLKQWREL